MRAHMLAQVEALTQIEKLDSINRKRDPQAQCVSLNP